MKFLSITLVVVIGAALSSWVTYRIVEPGPVVPESVQVPLGRHAAPPPPPAPGPAAAEFEQLSRANRDLAQELAEARARLERTDAALALARENLDELRRPMMGDLLSSALSAELKSGEVVVTGGYRLPDGTRLYAFVQPTVEHGEGGDVVKIASSVRTIADEAGTSVGLGNLATNADNTLQHGEVWMADEKRAVFEALDASSGTRAVSLPEVTVRPGASSVVEFGDLRLKVTPSLGADRDSLDFEVRVEQSRPVQSGETQPAASPAAPDK